MKNTVLALAISIGMTGTAIASSPEEYIQQCKSQMLASVNHAELFVEAPVKKVRQESLASKPAQTMSRAVHASGPVEQNSSNVVPQVTFTESEALRNPKDWCEYRGEDELFMIDVAHGYFGFVLRKGSLVDNLERLIDSYFPHNQGLISKIGNHIVPADTCIVETNKNLVIQKIVEPYQVENRAVQFGQFSNGIHAVFYKGDPEFHRYFAGVGR